MVALAGALLVVACAAPKRGDRVISSPPASSPPPAVRLLFLGDTSFGENYQEGGKNVLESRGYNS